jgi:hypothetical protein
MIMSRGRSWKFGYFAYVRLARNMGIFHHKVTYSDMSGVSVLPVDLGWPEWVKITGTKVTGR